MIYKAQLKDISFIADMAILMWKEQTIEELSSEFETFINGDDSVIFMYWINNQPIGFAQCQLRHDYVEGTDSSPVGYLEGIFIKEEYRKHGYAKELLSECEKWTLEKGCTEFASDCELTNSISLDFHLNVGFTEANRIICFKKNLI